jgi:hypothetical protein
MEEMNKNYSADLTIPVPHPLKDPSILNQFDDQTAIWFAGYDDVSKEYTAWLDSLGLVMQYPPLIFYTPKGKQCGIHVDGHSANADRACMNWCVQGAGSMMHWYRLKEDQKPFETTETQAGTPYIQFHPNQVDHLHSHVIKWPTIVQTGIPHNIHNRTWEPRWVISCDISKKENPDAGLTMNQALEIFKRWII